MRSCWALMQSQMAPISALSTCASAKALLCAADRWPPMDQARYISSTPPTTTLISTINAAVRPPHRRRTATVITLAPPRLPHRRPPAYDNGNRPLKTNSAEKPSRSSEGFSAGGLGYGTRRRPRGMRAAGLATYTAGPRTPTRTGRWPRRAPRRPAAAATGSPQGCGQP